MLYGRVIPLQAINNKLVCYEELLRKCYCSFYLPVIPAHVVNELGLLCMMYKCSAQRVT